MKRILFGTSALGLTLATFGMPASVAHAGCSFGTNAYICDSTSTTGENLSGAGNAAIINFVQNPINLTITGSDHDDVATVGSEVDGDPNSFGELGFSGLFFGAGNDTLGVGGSQELATGQQGEPGKIVNSQIEMEDGDDAIVVGGVIQNDQYNNVLTGVGDDMIAVNAGGSIVSSIMMGDGADQLINDGTIGGAVEMGAGDDRVQTSSSFNGILFMGEGDDVLHAIDKAPQQGSYNGPVTSGFTMLGGDGFDRLILDGVSSGANINLAEVDSFEQLVKQGSGTWVMHPNGGMNNTSFGDGIYINEGTVNFLNSQLQTYVYNQGTMTGALTLLATEQAADGAPAPFYNASTGTIAGDLTFTEFNDIFVNDGRISNLHTDGTTPVVIDMGLGSDEFRNTGSVSGTVSLGGGTDRFVMSDDTLFNVSPPGQIDGGADWDTIVLSGTGGRMMEVNAPASAIINFENLEVDNGEWALAADQSFNGDVNLNGGTLTVNTQLTSAGLNLNGGNMLLNGSYQGLATNINAGSLEIVNGLLNSNAYVGPDGQLLGNGRVTGNVVVDGGSITPDQFDGVGTMEIDGNLEVSETGTIIVNVDPENETADRFDVSGFLTIDDGATIEVVPISDFDPDEQYVFDIADAGLIDGNFTIAGDYQDYAIQYGDDGAVSLVMGSGWTQVGVTTGLTGGALGLDVNPAQIYAHLEQGAFAAGGVANMTGGMQALWDFVGSGSGASGAGHTNALASAALNGVSSEFYSAAYLQNRSYANYVRNKMVDRIDDKEWCATMQGAGEANCRAYRSDAGDAWGSLEILRASNDTSAVSAYEGTTIAGLIGMDKRMGLITTGLVGGFGSSTADVNTAGSLSGLSASLGGYFSLPMELLNIDGNAAYNYSTQDSSRTLAHSVYGAGAGSTNFSGTAKTHQFGGGVRLTQEYKNEFGLEVQPEVGVAVNYMMMPGFSESASDGSNLALIMEDTSHFDADAEVGVHVRRPYRTATATVIPEVRAKISKKIAGQTMYTQARFAGSDNTAVPDFQIATELPDMTYNLGVGVNYEMDSGLMVFGDYDYRGGSGQEEHQGSLGVRYDF